MSPSHAYKSSSRGNSHHDVNPCNAFLMGGSYYYPGKGKHRTHRGRAHWSRSFWCSRPFQVAVGAVIVSYVCLWWFLVPLISYTISVGAAFSGESRGNTFNAKSPMYLSNPDGPDRILLEPIDALRKRVVSTASSSNHHLANDRTRRNIKSIERIIPDFFHRNDRNSEEQPFPSKSHQSGLSSYKQQNRRTHLASPTTTSPNVTTFFITETRTPRTLLNMDQLQPTSACPMSLPTQPNVTLVIQCSLDRIWILNTTCARWSEPIVVALAVFPRDLRHDSTMTVDERLLSLNCPQAHIIKYSVDHSSSDEYPVNTLRNIALDAVQTSHLLTVDVDFVPSTDLALTIIKTLKERQQQRQLMPQKIVSDERDAIVVPAFERLQDCSSPEECASFLKDNPSFLPSNLDELKPCLVDHDCDVFQRGVNWEGHHSTNTPAWLKQEWYQEEQVETPDGTQQKISMLKQIDCFDSLRYEPYVVLRWCPSMSTAKVTTPVAPYYDERFFGYGKNKISTLTHLRMMGYRFAVLPQAFIIHNPHVESSVKAIWNDHKHHALHKDMDALYTQFLQELYDKYSNLESLAIKQC